MRKKWAAMLAATLATTGVAQAADYSFSFVPSGGGTISASGVLDLSDTATNGYYTVLSVTGTVTGPNTSGVTVTSQITQLSSFSSSDHQDSLTSPYFDLGGVAFTAASGVSFNMYYDPGPPTGYFTPGDYVINSYAAPDGKPTANSVEPIIFTQAPVSTVQSPLPGH